MKNDDLKVELINKHNRAKIQNIIITEFMDNNQYGSLVGKKLKETTVPYENILHILNENKEYIKGKTTSIQNRFGRVSYIFKVIENNYSIIKNYNL